MRRKTAAARQVPLRLGWCRTVHGAQSLEFDEVDVDLAGQFGVHQAYVAMSRAKSASGLLLRGCPTVWPRADAKVRWPVELGGGCRVYHRFNARVCALVYPVQVLVFYKGVAQQHEAARARMDPTSKPVGGSNSQQREEEPVRAFGRCRCRCRCRRWGCWRRYCWHQVWVPIDARSKCCFLLVPACMCTVWCARGVRGACYFVVVSCASSLSTRFAGCGVCSRGGNWRHGAHVHRARARHQPSHKQSHSQRALLRMVIVVELP